MFITVPVVKSDGARGVRHWLHGASLVGEIREIAVMAYREPPRTCLYSHLSQCYCEPICRGSLAVNGLVGFI